MKKEFYSIIKNRTILKITGIDAQSFLQNLLPIDLLTLSPKKIYPCALLTPQGKIAFDFLIALNDNGFLIDIAEYLKANFLKKINLYKLRSQINLEIFPIETVFITNKKALINKSFSKTYLDTRFPEPLKIFRTYINTSLSIPENGASCPWEKISLRYGIAESERDFLINTTFPQDINYDLFGAISTNKGCYIGQEVISRIYHRNAIKRRTILIKNNHLFPPKGTEIFAGHKVIGTLGSHYEKYGLAIVRIDHVEAALKENTPFLLNGKEITILNPKGKRLIPHTKF